jgi:hypothetical protein
MAAHKSFHASIHYQMMSFISTILTLPKNEFVIKQNRQHLIPFKLKTWNKTAIVAATIVVLFKKKKNQFQLQCRLFWGVFISLFFERRNLFFASIKKMKMGDAMTTSFQFNSKFALHRKQQQHHHICNTVYYLRWGRNPDFVYPDSCLMAICPI